MKYEPTCMPCLASPHVRRDGADSISGSARYVYVCSVVFNVAFMFWCTFGRSFPSFWQELCHSKCFSPQPHCHVSRFHISPHSVEQKLFFTILLTHPALFFWRKNTTKEISKMEKVKKTNKEQYIHHFVIYFCGWSFLLFARFEHT